MYEVSGHDSESPTLDPERNFYDPGKVFLVFRMTEVGCSIGFLWERIMQSIPPRLVIDLCFISTEEHWWRHNCYVSCMCVLTLCSSHGVTFRKVVDANTTQIQRSEHNAPQKGTWTNVSDAFFVLCVIFWTNFVVVGEMKVKPRSLLSLRVYLFICEDLNIIFFAEVGPTTGLGEV